MSEPHEAPDEAAYEQELLCRVCQWPFAPADPECGHEITEADA